MKQTFISYLDQLISHAITHEVDLKQACVTAGLPDSTYYRWITNRVNPNEDSARRVFNQIDKISNHGASH